MTVDARGGLIIPAAFAGNTIQNHAILKQVGTVNIDPANVGNAQSFNTDITITGVSVGDVVILQPPPSLEAELTFIGAAVQSANTVRVNLRSSASVNGASLAWGYLVFAKTQDVA